MNPGEYVEQNRNIVDYVQERDTWRSVATPENARRLAEFASKNPGISPNLAVAVAAGGNWGDTPTMREIVEADVSRTESGFMSWMKGASRIGFVALESPWQEMTGLLRTGTRFVQGEGLLDAYRSSSPSTGVRAAVAAYEGEPVHLGTGWFPGEQPAEEFPEYRPMVDKALAQGKSLADAHAEAEAVLHGDYGYPLQSRYDEVAESTLIHKNGYSSPVSLGTLTAITVTHPGSGVFPVLSGMVDFASRVGGLDPIDAPFNEIVLWRQMRKAIVPPQADAGVRRAVLEAAADDLGIDLGDISSYDDGRRGTLMGVMDPNRSANPELKAELDHLNDIINGRVKDVTDDEYFALVADYNRKAGGDKLAEEELLEWAKEARYVGVDLDAIASSTRATEYGIFNDDFPRMGHDVSSPYGDAYAELDRLSREQHGIGFQEFIYRKYGDAYLQELDNTLTHELIHAEDQYDPYWQARYREIIEEYKASSPNQPLRQIQDRAAAQMERETGARAATYGKAGEDAKNYARDRRLAVQDMKAKRIGKSQELNVRRETLVELQDELSTLQGTDEVVEGSKWENMSRKERAAHNKAREARIEELDAAIKLETEKAAKAEKELKEFEELVDDFERWGEASAAAEYDATLQTGLKMMADEGVLKAARDAAMKEAGLVSAWRPWSKPQMMEDWLTSTRGQRVIKYLANNQSISKQRKVVKDLPGYVQQQILRATNETEVISALAPHLGRELAEVPNIGLGGRVATKAGSALEAVAEKEFIGGIAGKVTVSAHRLGSKSVNLVMDPQNLEKTLDHTEAWLRTARATDDEVDTILTKIINEKTRASLNNQWADYSDVYNDIAELYAKKLGEQLGDSKYKQEIIDSQMQDFTKAILDSREYWVDAAGNKIDDLDGLFTEMWSQGAGEGRVVPNFSAVLESQTSMTKLHLPNGREIRRATSDLHLRTQRIAEAIRSKGGDNTEVLMQWFAPDGLDDAWGIRFLDGVHTFWRDMALLRVGWPLRVLPEEMLRQAASGYGMMITDPVSYIGLMMRSKMSKTAFGDDMKSVMSLEDLGSGRFRANPLEYNATRQAWTTVRKGQKGYKEGIAGEFMQLANDEIAARVARDGVDDTLAWMQTPDGFEVANRATRNSGGMRIDLSNPEGMQVYVDRAEAMIAQMTGGEWVRKNSNGRWVDMWGVELTDWADMTKDQILAKINASRAAREYAPITVKASSYNKQHWIDIAMEETGVPSFKSLPEHKEYVTIRQGNEELRNVIGHRRRPGTGTTSEYDEFVAEFDELQKRVSAAEKQSDPADWTPEQRAAYDRGDYNEFSRLRGYTEEEIAEYNRWREMVGDAPAEEVQRMDGDIDPYFLADYKGLSKTRMPDGDEIIFDSMKIKSRSSYDMEDLANDIEILFENNGVQPPEFARTARAALEKGADQYNHVVDTAFEVLMAKPSAYLNRSPFFKQKYSEEMARVYLFADANLRRKLKHWAVDNGVTRMFNRHINDAKLGAGFAKVPPAGKGGDRSFGVNDLELLDELARKRGLQATRDLFYDLAERQNITDMTKHIFPFADAWFEVLSRWAKIMLGDTGRSVKNWHRLQVGVGNARKSGFFSEDQYGNEVFNWPGAGLLAPWMAGGPVGTGMDAKASIDQLMFINPDPRGMMMPGVGPIVQLPASWVVPKVEEFPPLRDAMSWFAFGDFESIEPQSTGEAIMNFFPSWSRQLGVALTGNDRRTDVADEVGQVYETLIMSGNREYGQANKEQMRRTLEQAQKTGTALSWLKLLDRFFMPATPNYSPEIVTEALDSDDPFWMTSLAVNREYHAAREMFGGDSDMAREYVIARFGLDPLDTYSNNYMVREAPATKSAYDQLVTSDIRKHSPITMMAWVVEPPDDPFFNPAWQRQFAEGDRVKLTPEERAWAINEQAGWNEWELVRSEAEEREAQIKANMEPRSPARTMALDALQQWKNGRKRQIYEDYWAWDNAGRREGSELPERPSAEVLWDELIIQGTPGTEAHGYLSQYDPEMMRFVEGFAAKVDLMRNSATNEEMNWWITSTTPTAKALRAGFVDYLEGLALSLPPSQQERARHILDRYVDPVLTDFEFDEQLLLIPKKPPTPEIPAWSDKVDPELFIQGQENPYEVANG